MAYLLAYAFAGFTTFASILGRSAYAHDEDEIICGCSDIASHNHKLGSEIKQTFVTLQLA
jgi:hypothetical protein